MKTVNIIKTLVLLAVLVGIRSEVSSQSRYFDERYIYTQTHLNPTLINPGAYGYEMDHSILLNYRNKWSGIDGAPNTLTLGYNGSVGNRLGLGLNIMSDKFGQLETFKGGVGLSYTIVSDRNQIGFGLAAEYIKHGLAGLGNATPGDPIINQALEGAEYFDATFGLYGVYLGRLTYGLVLPSAISSRISDDNISGNSDRQLGVILQAGYKVDVHHDITITPSLVMKKLNNVPTHIDLNLTFGFLEDKLIGGVNYTIGADKRIGFLIGTKIEMLNFYYSYNGTSHRIQDYNNGSHELTLGVHFGGKKAMEKPVVM